MTWRCPKCEYPNPDDRNDCFKCGDTKPQLVSDPLPTLQDLRQMDHEPDWKPDPRDYSALRKIAHWCEIIAVIIVALSILACMIILIMILDDSRARESSIEWLIGAEIGIICNAVIDWIIFKGVGKLILLFINVAEDVQSIARRHADVKASTVKL